MKQSQQDKQLVSSWGLPKPVLDQLARKGLMTLYPWQAACLECGAAGNNLVYCAPTSGGKSLVAEMLMLARMHSMQQAISQRKHKQTDKRNQQPLPRGLMVLPYLSIVSEKTQHLSQLLADVKWQVRGYQGTTEGQPLSNKVERIAICSIEKANMAINHLIQEGRLHELVSVVIDEAHMLADPHRGAALEMLLSKLVACRDKCCVQIVAMSATMAGLDCLSTWLNAHLFLTNFRPVPLTEHAVFEGTVYTKQNQAVGAADTEPDNILVESRSLSVRGKDDKWSLLALVSEVVKEGHSVLVFCCSRHAAQSCATMLSRELTAYVGPPSPAQVAERQELVHQLRLALVGIINQELEQMFAAGVAYHHAGLTQQERTVVESGYRSGTLLVLTATSTLAAGVNLPARRVILRSLWQGVGPVSRAQYLQMVGRAGRAGQSPVGESFLLGKGPAGAPPSRFCEWLSVCKLMAAPLPVLTTSLVDTELPLPSAASIQQSTPASSGSSNSNATQQQPSISSQPVTTTSQPMLQHLLLHAVAVGLISTGHSVAHLLQCTLAFHQLPSSDLQNAAKAALGALRMRKLISLKPDTPTRPSHWELTALGQAVVASTMPPELGLLLHNRLEVLMRECIVLGCNAHLLYVLLPEPLFNINDWNQWQRLAADMTAQHKRIARVEGIELSYIQRRCGGVRGDSTVDARHARFAAAMLLDLVVADASCVLHVEKTWGKPDSLTKMGISRGQLQAWQLEVSRTAAMAALLASNAAWWQLETLLVSLAAQAAAGVRPELLPLMQVSGIQPAYACALHAAGFSIPELLVAASESEVAAALSAKLPNFRKRKNTDKSGVNFNPGSTTLVVRAAKSILAAARQFAVHRVTAAVDESPTGILDASQESVQGQQDQMQLWQQHQIKPIHGQATVHYVWPQKGDPLLNQLLDAWQLQPSFSFAVVIDQQRCAVEGCQASRTLNAGISWLGDNPTSPAQDSNTAAAAAAATAAVDGSVCSVLHCQHPVALVLCWTDRDAAVLQLPGPSAAVSNPVASRVWGTIKAVFGDPERTAVCCGAVAAVAALTAAGVQCRLTVDDPCAAFLLWQPGVTNQPAMLQQQHGVQVASELSSVLKAAHMMVLGDSYKLKVPIGPNPAQSEASRSALLARALMPPVRSLLVRQKLTQLYEQVERPLQLAMGSVRKNGLQVEVAAIKQMLQQSQRHRQLLQQHVHWLLNGLDVSVAAGVHGFLTRSQLIPPNSELKSQSMPLVLLRAVRAAIKRQQHGLLPAIRCALTYWQCEVFEQQLTSLLQYAVGASSGDASDNLSKHVLLQPLPTAAGTSKGTQQGWAVQLSTLLTHVAVPALPMAVTELSLSDQEVTSLPAAKLVTMMIPLSEYQQQQQQQQQHQKQQYLEFSGILCSLSQQAAVTSSELPLGGSLDTDVPSYCGCIRYWCSVSQAVQELQLSLSAIHSVQQEQPQNRASFLPGTISMAAGIQPRTSDHVFVGVELQHLPVLVLASLSKDQVLFSALSQQDLLAAAADDWLQRCGMQRVTVELLLAHVAAGSATGVPLPPQDARKALFKLAVDALVLGQKPSVQRGLLAVDHKGVNLAESLMQAFPGLAAWQQGLLEDCQNKGYLQSVMGRKLPFKVPTANSNHSGKNTRAFKEASRMACSLTLMASVDDIQRLAAAALYRCCCSCSVTKWSYVMCSDRQLVLEVSAAHALVFLKAAAAAVHGELTAALGFEQGSKACRLPLEWWWGSTLDVMQGNWFRV